MLAVSRCLPGACKDIYEEDDPGLPLRCISRPLEAWITIRWYDKQGSNKPHSPISRTDPPRGLVPIPLPSNSVCQSYYLYLG